MNFFAFLLAVLRQILQTHQLQLLKLYLKTDRKLFKQSSYLDGRSNFTFHIFLPEQLSSFVQMKEVCITICFISSCDLYFIGNTANRTETFTSESVGL